MTAAQIIVALIVVNAVGALIGGVCVLVSRLFRRRGPHELR